MPSLAALRWLLPAFSALALTACYGLQPTNFPDVGEEELVPDTEETPEDDEEELPEDDPPIEEDDPVDEDAATLLSFEVPQSMECGETVVASVLMGNSGSATWTRDTGYKLGFVGDEDPLVEGEPRVWLGPDEAVEPGQSYLFLFELQAPEEEGTHLSDWQMVHEGVHWFGDVGSQQIEVYCPETEDPEPPPPDLSTVTWLHSDVSQWPETATLSPISTSSSNICLDYDMANVWPIYNIGVDVVANPWIFIWQDAQWYAGTWEWLRPGQTCKAITSVAGDHIKVAPFGENSGWVPTSGTTYYFMVSGLARFSERNVEERSNLVPFVWP